MMTQVRRATGLLLLDSGTIVLICFVFVSTASGANPGVIPRMIDGLFEEKVAHLEKASANSHTNHLQIYRALYSLTQLQLRSLFIVPFVSDF